ncbi:chromatin remodeling protein [Marchantia polymorpha subsp. ruderalis]|uniref:BAH domain-containing protein n=2 Tax=Marchantia polymorpha TaxID=3197 RepID=A0AAF6BBA5_MARPO|nr:hypothetical protein MARPO_0041s0134 [Marchantia polymorpha]BBN09289.1 hypothetical protein Mp_4g18530 [Marchantia polymorpha subsp. ruderalis]|eukprot:PTQ40278.1 hypothetical protein MARPO_0041s0134 [Marchantia polymorpha]
MKKRELRSLVAARETKSPMKTRLSSGSPTSVLPSQQSAGRRRNTPKKLIPENGVDSGAKKLTKTTVDSYKIPGSRNVVKVGDCVLIRAPQRVESPYVARIEKIEQIPASDKVKTVVKLRWFYHPEETVCGRRPFHGEQELCKSDHFDSQDADCIQGKCKVYTFEDYCMLKEVDKHDYFWRFEYQAASQTLSPDSVDVYCICEMPYNPDHFMVQCEMCSDWFHPSCVKLSQEQVATMEAYVCLRCSR